MPRSNLKQAEKEIGQRIKIRREEMGLSQTDLGDGIGVTFQQVQKYEAGTNRCSSSRLVKVAETLKTTVGALVGAAGGVAPPGGLELLTEPGCLDLVHAFARIKDQNQRRRIVALVESIAPAGKAELRRVG